MKRSLAILLLIIGTTISYPSKAADNSRLSGRILLQVEENGEAWYVNPSDARRYYLGRPDDAFRIMKELGLGISNADIKKIPVGLEYINGQDSDGDGLSDNFEKAVGTDFNIADTDGDGWNDFQELESGNDPLGSGKLPLSPDLVNKFLGRIFIQTEKKGEAWYLDPVNAKRYYLGLPDDAFAVMRSLGLGISNNDLREIPTKNNAQIAGDIDKKIHALVNAERLKMGLPVLSWNSELAEVAKEHSADLADENLAYTGLGRSCDYPLIHHEGTEFGLYNLDRLNSRGINYFSKTAENIALLSRATYKISYRVDEPVQGIIDECRQNRTEWDNEFKNRVDEAETEQEKIALLESEISRRSREFSKTFEMNIEEIYWETDESLALEAVNGWMESPGHRDNILNKAYDEAGIGSSYLDGYFIVTQVFIERAECGFAGGACCEKKGYYPYCFVPLECVNGLCAVE